MNHFTKLAGGRQTVPGARRRRPAPRARARAASHGASTKSGAQCCSARSAYWARLARFCDTGFLRELKGSCFNGSVRLREQFYVPTCARCSFPPADFFVAAGPAQIRRAETVAGPACASEDGLLWRKHKVGSAMLLLFTLFCVLGAVGAILRYRLLAGAQGLLLLGSTRSKMQCYITRARCCCPPGFFLLRLALRRFAGFRRCAARRTHRVRPRPLPPCCPASLWQSRARRFGRRVARSLVDADHRVHHLRSSSTSAR
jgi:hypothetical protein